MGRIARCLEHDPDAGATGVYDLRSLLAGRSPCATGLVLCQTEPGSRSSLCRLDDVCARLATSGIDRGAGRLRVSCVGRAPLEATAHGAAGRMAGADRRLRDLYGPI